MMRRAKSYPGRRVKAASFTFQRPLRVSDKDADAMDDTTPQAALKEEQVPVPRFVPTAYPKPHEAK